MTHFMGFLGIPPSKKERREALPEQRKDWRSDRPDASYQQVKPGVLRQALREEYFDARQSWWKSRPKLTGLGFLGMEVEPASLYPGFIGPRTPEEEAAQKAVGQLVDPCSPYADPSRLTPAVKLQCQLKKNWFPLALGTAAVLAVGILVWPKRRRR